MLHIKKWLWAFLLRRSPFHQTWEPNRRNTLLSVLLVVVMFPITVIVFPPLVVRVLLAGKIRLFVLKPYTEFAFMLYMFERIRGGTLANRQPHIVLVRTPFRHKGLAHLYGSHLQCPICWSSGATVLFAQIFMLQPSWIIERVELTTDDFIRFSLVDEPVNTSKRILKIRNEILSQQDVNPSRYVAMAVYTSTSEEKLDPGYVWKSVVRETVGTELVDGVDFLKSNAVDVVMLGFPDTGKAHIPRIFPRLTDFGKIGGLTEVALASGCLYFWADDVGAQWLREPFKKPVLLTNAAEVFGPKNQFSDNAVKRFLSVPIRFQTSSGHLLTIREQLLMSPRRFQALAKGEVRIIRNSTEDIVEAHQEMLSTIDGTWVEDSQTLELSEQLERIYSEFPQYPNRPLPTKYLLRYSYLLD